jgi:hypothetical protein
MVCWSSTLYSCLLPEGERQLQPLKDLLYTHLTSPADFLIKTEDQLAILYNDK